MYSRALNLHENKDKRKKRLIEGLFRTQNMTKTNKKINFKNTPSHKFIFNPDGHDELIDTALKEDQIIRLYNDVFQYYISYSRLTDEATNTTFSEETGALVESILLSVIMAKAMGREVLEKANTCLPHMCLFLESHKHVAVPPRRLFTLYSLVKHGKPLHSYKGLLLTLPIRKRVLWTVAWVINRCRKFRETTRVALPLCLRTHMNLLCITYIPDHNILIEHFEPNGLKSIHKGISIYFKNLTVNLRKLNLVPENVEFKSIGTGIQTALGVWHLKIHNDTVRLRSRGYPVCSAICVWAFRMFMKSSSKNLEEFDLDLSIQLKDWETRHKLQRQFYTFLQSLANWVHSEEGRKDISESLIRNFRDSMVNEITIYFGSISRPLQLVL